jgi:hypothetical protein
MRGVLDPNTWIKRQLLLLDRAYRFDIEITDVYFYDASDLRNDGVSQRWLEFGDKRFNFYVDRRDGADHLGDPNLAQLFRTLGSVLRKINNHIDKADQAKEGATIHLRHDYSATAIHDLRLYAAESGHRTTGIAGSLSFADENKRREGPDYDFPQIGDIDQVYIAVQGTRTTNGSTYWYVPDDERINPVATGKVVVGKDGTLRWYY